MDEKKKGLLQQFQKREQYDDSDEDAKAAISFLLELVEFLVGLCREHNTGQLYQSRT